MTSPGQRHAVELSRNLGFFDATMIGVGAMIGAGIFVLTGLAITRQPCDVAVLKAHGSQAGPFRKVLLPLGGKEVHDRLKSRLVHSLGGPGGQRRDSHDRGRSF